MYEANRAAEVVRLAAAILLAAAISASALPRRAVAGEDAASPKINSLLTSLAKEWLAEQSEKKAAPPPAQKSDPSVADYLNSSVGAIPAQIVALARAIADLPSEFERAAHRITAVRGEYGRTKALLNLAVFAALAFGAEWLFRTMTARVRRRLDRLPTATLA
jgi:hypothetical protein